MRGIHSAGVGARPLKSTNQRAQPDSTLTPCTVRAESSGRQLHSLLLSPQLHSLCCYLPIIPTINFIAFKSIHFIDSYLP